MATYVSKYTGKQIDSVVEKVLGNNSGGGSTEKESAVLTVTVTGNDTDGYTADMTFAEIVAAELDGKVVQVYLNGAVHHLTSKSGDDCRAFSRVEPNPYVEDGGIIEVSMVDFRSDGNVFVSHYSFNSNGGDNDPRVFEVEITGDDTDGYTADKTFSEIMTAEAQGKVVLVRYNVFYCTLICSYPSLRVYTVEYRGASEGELVRDEFALRPDRSSGAVVILHNRMVFNTSGGVSHTVSVTEIEGGHRITVNDVDGDKTFDVMNGQDGIDGVSPTAKVTQTDNGAVITMTDKNGTTTATITNGATYTLTEEDEARIVATVMDNFIDVSEVGA